MRRLKAHPAWSQRAPLLVMVLVLLLTAAVSLVLSTFVREQQQNRFDREVEVYTDALKTRIDEYERLLLTSRAAWLTHPDMLDEGVFARFIQGIELTRRSPGVQAIGYGPWLPSGRPDAALLERLRRRVRPDFTIRQAESPQTASVPIAVIAPPTAVNLGAIGFDLYSEAQRRAAMDAARRTGVVQTTGQLLLVQRGADGERLRGFLMMLPVGPEGQAPSGFIYMAVRADEFVQGLRPAHARQPYVQVRLGNADLYGTRPGGGMSFQQSEQLELAGQRWQIEFSADSRFGQDFAALVPLITLLSGMLIAGLAFLVVQAQVGARQRAEGLNVSLGQARLLQEQARAEFEAIFQSMQDAAAFTDEAGRIRLVNRALADQFGVEPGELIGQPLSVLHEDLHLAGHTAFQAVTTPYRRADASVFSGEAQRSEVVDPEGRRLGLLEVVRDVSERVQAERAVQSAQRRYRGLLDAIPHIVRVSDPAGQVTFVNAQHQLLLGTDDLLARMSPEDREGYLRLSAQATAQQGSAQMELSLALADGRQHWFVLHFAPLRGERGEVVEWVTSLTDIHDQLVAERLAQRNEERSRGVLEGLPQIVWLTDPQGEAVYFNRRWQEYVGEERAAQGFIDLIHPDDRPGYRQRWQSAIRAARPFEAEHRILGAGGRYRTFVTRGLPVSDASGQVIEWVGTCTDVDDSVYAENAARLLADVSQQLTLRGDVLSHERGGQYRAALATLTARFVDSAALWSVWPMEVVANSFTHPAWNEPHMRTLVLQAMERVAATAEPLILTAHPLLHSVHATGALVYPLLGQNGALCGMLGLAYRHALTERDQELAHELAGRFAAALENDALQRRVIGAQQDLQALNQSLEERVERRTLELENANRELEAFSYSVSHDLRTPLRHIVGFGDLLGKEAGAAGLSPKAQRYLGIITESASRMSQLIDDLLEFSRMGRQELRSVPVDLGALVGASWQALEPDRQGRQIEFVLPPLPTIHGDPTMLELVFTNLLSNAVKYTRTRAQARIEVAATVEDGEVTVTIRDNGVGFDPKYVDKLFGVFQRLHRADEFEGIGIGLANVRRIVGRHGGRVVASSVLGEGAAFSVTLPIQEPQ